MKRTDRYASLQKSNRVPSAASTQRQQPRRLDEIRAEIGHIVACVRDRVQPPALVVEQSGGIFTFGDALDTSKHVELIASAKADHAQDGNNAATASLRPSETAAQQATQRRRSSNCALPSTARVAEAIRRKSVVRPEPSRAEASAEPKQQHFEILAQHAKRWCDRSDGIMQLALAGVLDTSSSSYEETKRRDQLLYSAMAEGTRPFDIAGTIALPSYAALHSRDEWREPAPEELPRELLGFFVQ